MMGRHIYSVLGDSSASVAALNTIELRDENNEPDPGALVDGNGNPVPVYSARIECMPIYIPPNDTDEGGAICAGIFFFESFYTPESDTTLQLGSGKKIVVGHDNGTTFTPYFELTSIGDDGIAVNSNITYASLHIVWQITVP